MSPSLSWSHIKTPDFVHEILDDPAFKQKLAEVADETGQSLKSVTDETRSNLIEIGGDKNGLAVDGWDRLARWFGRGYNLDVHPDQVAKLKELNDQYPLIFLPNHRSYLDPLVLRSALAEQGMEPNHTLGGANLSFWPIGSVARRNGMVFIRREFKDDLVYKTSLKEYIAYLVRKKENLEWYIEGGRTRSGKLRPPRMGILSYVVDAFDNNVEPPHDVLIVPTFVGYDQQYEVEAISEEELGGSKNAESVSWMVEFARAQRKRRGSAHLRFGEPLSMREALAANRAETGKNAARMAVPKIAFEVMHRINQATPVMPSALVTFALLDNGGRHMTLDEGLRVVKPLIEYIRLRGIDISSEVDFEAEGLMHQTLRTLTREGVIDRYDGGVEPVYGIADDRQHEAAFYRNTLIHYFITRAIVEVALVYAAESDAQEPIEAVWDEAVRLRDILKYEFFFPKTDQFAIDVTEEVDLAYPDWEKQSVSPDEILPLLKEIPVLLSHRVLGPFLEAYSVFADRLALQPADVEVDREALILECIGVASQRWKQRELHSPESISRDMFSGAWQLADNRGLITGDPADLTERREEFADEFRQAVRRVDVIRGWELAREVN